MTTKLVLLNTYRFITYVVISGLIFSSCLHKNKNTNPNNDWINGKQITDEEAEYVNQDKTSELGAVISDENTIEFSINPATGEILGCPLIRKLETSNEEIRSNQEQIRQVNRNKFEKIREKLRPVIMQEHSNELWYGDPDNVSIEGTPEAIHSGRGPIGFIYHENDSLLIVPVGYPHGGDMDEIYFLNVDGNVMVKHSLDRILSAPIVNVNREQTFVTVSSTVNGDFYIFHTSGTLFKKGNFNEQTGDKGTSYNSPIISETGKIWVLCNNENWSYSDSNLLSITHQLILDLKEDKYLGLGLEYENIYNRTGRYSIIDLKNSKILYRSNIIKLNLNRYELQN